MRISRYLVAAFICNSVCMPQSHAMISKEKLQAMMDNIRTTRAEIAELSKEYVSQELPETFDGIHYDRLKFTDVKEKITRSFLVKYLKNQTVGDERIAYVLSFTLTEQDREELFTLAADLELTDKEQSLLKFHMKFRYENAQKPIESTVAQETKRFYDSLKNGDVLKVYGYLNTGGDPKWIQQIYGQTAREILETARTQFPKKSKQYDQILDLLSAAE